MSTETGTPAVDPDQADGPPELQEARAGAPAEIDELLAALTEFVTAYARWVSPNGPAATAGPSDIAQNTLQRLATRLEQIRELTWDQLKSYAATVVQNEVIRCHGHEATWKRGGRRGRVSGEALAHLPAPHPRKSPLSAMAEAELAEAVAAAGRTLDVTDAELFDLRFGQHLSLRDIARVTGLSLDVVRRRVERIKQTVADLVDKNRELRDDGRA